MPAHGPQAVDTAGSTWIRHWPPWRSTGHSGAPSGNVAQGLIGGGGDGDADHGRELIGSLALTQISGRSDSPNGSDAARKLAGWRNALRAI